MNWPKGVADELILNIPTWLAWFLCIGLNTTRALWFAKYWKAEVEVELISPTTC